MIDYMWERGWDKEQGGILYFRDVYNKPVQEYWQDMKFWWPHNEVIIATLLAYLLTGDEKYSGMHRQVHEYAYKHFYDKKTGNGLVTSIGMAALHKHPRVIYTRGHFICQGRSGIVCSY
jgi:mannose/cellobiose epimerase-like protein (N-acyl-D-glucosamine 2-epimerase family)